MNIRIAKTLLVLSIVYIVAFYIVKFIFPEFLLLQITDPNVLALGKFVESSKVYLYLYNMLTTFITFYLFISASRGSFRLNLKQFLVLLTATIMNKCIAVFLPDLYVHTSTSLMFVCAWLCKGKISYIVPTFVIHGYLSQFLSSIRGFETIWLKINTASGTVLMIEGWIWLIILGLLFYLKEKQHGRISTTISKQND